MTARTFSQKAGLALALVAPALALAGPAPAQDPPARVGRIAYLAGPVSFAPAGVADWAQAPLNRPLVAGDRLWTDAAGRDEVQFGSALARMDAGTLLTVLAADERTTQLQVSQGRIDLRVRALAPGETVEVDTPNLAFVARQPGDYRLTVAPDGGTTDVTVLRGAADAYGDGTALALNPGQGYRFGGQDLNGYTPFAPPPPDDFDRWALGRDARYERAVAHRYVPQGVVGAEDLDDYGTWRDVPDYGTVWVPDRAPRNWAPYHTGHWSWIDPWGWTWIDDQPYGYAVSHYGRWIRTPDTWAWVPAPVQARPVYAPALVAFVGTALAIGSWNGPGVGWFPLAPHEPYRPPYHASPTYITNVNVTNTVIRQTNIVNNINVTNINYRNRMVPGAMVAMPAPQFAQAAPTARAGLLLPPGVARAAPVLARPDARPLPQSRFGSGPASRLPPAPALQRVALARALPAAAFAHAAPGPATGRPGVPAVAQGIVPGAPHGVVPALRMVRPVHGRLAAPRPAVLRPDVDVAGRHGGPVQGRPGYGGQSVPLPSQSAHGMMPLAGMPANPASGPRPPLGHLPVGPVPHRGDPDTRPAAPQQARAPNHRAPGVQPDAVRAGGQWPDGAPRYAAHGAVTPPQSAGVVPQPAGGPGAAAHPGRVAGDVQVPQERRDVAAHRQDAARVPGRALAPEDRHRSQPEMHAPAAQRHPQPEAHGPAGHMPPQIAERAPAPQSHPQPGAHGSAPAPHPQPAMHASAPPPHPQPAARPAAPRPEPRPAPRAEPPHPAPHDAPHPQPHPATPGTHGPDKGGEHGHGHNEHGGH